MSLCLFKVGKEELLKIYKRVVDEAKFKLSYSTIVELLLKLISIHET